MIHGSVPDFSNMRVRCGRQMDCDTFRIAFWACSVLWPRDAVSDCCELRGQLVRMRSFVLTVEAQLQHRRSTFEVHYRRLNIDNTYQ